MIFSSLTFLFAYLPVTLAVYFLMPLRARNAVLLLVSLVFYGWGEPVYISIMVLSTLIDYTHGMLVEHFRNRDRLARWFVGQSVISRPCRGWTCLSCGFRCLSASPFSPSRP